MSKFCEKEETDDKYFGAFNLERVFGSLKVKSGNKLGGKDR